MVLVGLTETLRDRGRKAGLIWGSYGLPPSKGTDTKGELTHQDLQGQRCIQFEEVTIRRPSAGCARSHVHMLQGKDPLYTCTPHTAAANMPQGKGLGHVYPIPLLQTAQGHDKYPQRPTGLYTTCSFEILGLTLDLTGASRRSLNIFSDMALGDTAPSVENCCTGI